MMMNQLIVII